MGSKEKLRTSQKISIVGPCTLKLKELFGKFAKYALGFFLMYALCNVSHFLLKPYSQPRITSDTVIGLLIGNLGFIRNLVTDSARKTLNFIVDFGMICYMFVLGIEMDPYVLFKEPTKDAKVAYGGMLSTFILACAITPFLQFTDGGFKVDSLSPSPPFSLAPPLLY